MRWYIGKGDARTPYETDSIIGVVIAPDDLSRDEVKEAMDSGGWELFVRPYWDFYHHEIYSLLTWEELSRDLQKCVVVGSEKGKVWTGVDYRPFLIVYWDEVARRIAEPAALKEIDRLAQRKGSFRRAKTAAELLRILNQDQE